MSPKTRSSFGVGPGSAVDVDTRPDENGAGLASWPSSGACQQGAAARTNVAAANATRDLITSLSHIARLCSRGDEVRQGTKRYVLPQTGMHIFRFSTHGLLIAWCAASLPNVGTRLG